MSSHRVKTLRLVWIEAFIALAEHGSFTVAAGNLGVSQPSMSRYIDHLQRWLRKVVITGGESPTLTADGEAFLLVARQIVDQLKNSRANLP